MCSIDKEFGVVKCLGRGICVAMAVVKRRNVLPSEPTFEPLTRGLAMGLGHKDKKYGISGQNKDSTVVCRWDVSLFQSSIVFTAVFLPLSVSSEYHTFRRALGSGYGAPLFRHATHDTGQPR